MHKQIPPHAGFKHPQYLNAGGGQRSEFLWSRSEHSVSCSESSWEDAPRVLVELLHVVVQALGEMEEFETFLCNEMEDRGDSLAA